MGPPTETSRLKKGKHKGYFQRSICLQLFTFRGFPPSYCWARHSSRTNTAKLFFPLKSYRVVEKTTFKHEYYLQTVALPLHIPIPSIHHRIHRALSDSYSGSNDELNRDTFIPLLSYNGFRSGARLVGRFPSIGRLDTDENKSEVVCARVS